MTASHRVLLIQGSGGFVAKLVDTLRSRGFEVELVGSSAQALARAHQRIWDVVVTNPSSAISEDIALLAELGQAQPGLKTIVLAPEATPEDGIAALRAHAFACYRAPIDPDEVASMIDRALAARDWRDGISIVSAGRDWIELRVASRRLTAERLIAFIDVLLAGPPDENRDALVLAFREILMNAIEHGAGFDPEKVVEVSAIKTAKANVFYFRDPGPGFSLDKLPHAAVSNRPDEPLAHVEYRVAKGMRPGGFGMLMTRQLVDEVIYNELGNAVILIKHTSRS